jgi:hypothetical protein
MKRFNLRGAFNNRREYQNFYYRVTLLEVKENKGKFVVYYRETNDCLYTTWLPIEEDDFFECEYIEIPDSPYNKIYAD